MNSTLFPPDLDPDVFATNISSYLHIEHLNNLYRTCRDMNKQLDHSGRYIYKNICLHHQPHSVCDLPALIFLNGDRFCYREGKYHRDDLPGRFDSNGQYWYKEGKVHRDGDLPAIIFSNGSQAWYKEGKRHRDGNLPAVIYSCGDQYWYKEGKRHRDDDLPAVIYSNGNQYWYMEGKKHRANDLPAVICSNGNRYWYTEGKQHRDPV
jgi:hypothetical protein